MSNSIEKATNALTAVIDTPIAAFFNSCVHCGLCADACLFYTETGDPKYTPIHKVEPLRKIWKQKFTFWGRVASLLGISKSLSMEELKEWETLVYDSCTLCGRCSLQCPLGNDITYMIRKQREGFVAAGVTPPTLAGATQRAVEFGSPMGDLHTALEAQVKATEAATGLKIPLDVQDADYMMLLSAMEVVQFSEIIGAVAKIFDKAGVSWTLSTDCFEATNAGIQIGSSDLAGQLVQRVVDAAEKLGVKYVISPECGHAYTALRWEGPNLIGRPYPFRVVHLLELLDQLRAEGRLKTEGMDATPLTFHDPCQIVRRGGVIEQPRRLLNMVASDFKEMSDHGKWNWCCGGGGGVSSNERATPLRLKVFSKKKAQLDELGVEKMVTACANCRNMLEEGLEEYEMNVQVVGLSEMIAEHLAD